VSTAAALLAPRRPFPGLFWEMIRRPSQAMAHVLAQRSWLAMGTLVTLMAILPVLASAPFAASQAQEAMRQTLEAQEGAMGRLTPEMEQRALASSANPLLITVLPAVQRAASVWIGWLLWAGGLSLLSAMTGGKTSFRPLWPLVVWAWLPYALRGLLQSAFILATGTLIANPGLSGLILLQESAAGMLAASPGPGPLALKSFLAQIDLFLFWNLALLAIGLAIASRLTPRKSALVVLGLWLVLTLIGLVPAVITGSMLNRF
jgi:hypothetical protein